MTFPIAIFVLLHLTPRFIISLNLIDKVQTNLMTLSLPLFLPLHDSSWIRTPLNLMKLKDQRIDVLKILLIRACDDTKPHGSAARLKFVFWKVMKNA